MKLIKVCLIVSILMLTIGSTLGCNTVRGVGKDVQKGGQAIQDAATK